MYVKFKCSLERDRTFHFYNYLRLLFNNSCVSSNTASNVPISADRTKEGAGLFKREGGLGNLLCNAEEILCLSKVHSCQEKTTVTTHKRPTKHLQIEYNKILILVQES